MVPCSVLTRRSRFERCSPTDNIYLYPLEPNNGKEVPVLMTAGSLVACCCRCLPYRSSGGPSQYRPISVTQCQRHSLPGIVIRWYFPHRLFSVDLLTQWINGMLLCCPTISCRAVILHTFQLLDRTSTNK